MPRTSLQNKRVILTGASSGIGRELALALAKYKTQQILVARSVDKLKTLQTELQTQHGLNCEIVAGDVTLPETRAQALQLAQQQLGGLDLLINNAGIGALGRFADAQPERLRQIMEVNFFAAAEFIREAVPMLQQSQAPVVVNIGSILGHRGVPHSSEYCASKFALHGLTEAIRPELKRLGIDTLLISPGTTETDFDAHRIQRLTEEPWPSQPGVRPEIVAQAILKAIERRKHEIIPNFRGRLLCWANRLSPRLVDRVMQRYG